MRCPHCGFEGELLRGGCARCGYGRKTGSSASYRLANIQSSSSRPPVVQTLTRGAVLQKGRYHVTEQLALPENQQGQGTAWLATDTKSSQRLVEIREVIVPPKVSSDSAQVVRSIALRMAELGQHGGFPSVLDMFSEQGSYYIVLEHIEGETLATLLRRQGGALPERTVAEYGRQLCELLTRLSEQQPPFIHGSINPDAIVVSPDRSRVSLTNLPLFTPVEPSSNKTSSGYFAPEQVRGTVEPSSDLYGLAATLHHAVTGYDPRERLAFFHPPARRLNPAVTAGMETILAKALRLSPSQRYSRPFDMQRDVTALIASYPPLREELPKPGALNNTLQLSSAQLRQWSRNRSRTYTGIFAVVCVLLLAVVVLVMLRPFPVTFAGSTTDSAATATSTVQQAALNKELALEMQTFQKKGIGISDGRIVFDTYTGRPSDEVSLKKQAAQAIQHGDLSSAVNFLTKATTADPTDGEAQIYNEDLHILQNGAPYVTIVLGIAFDSSAADYLLARPELQGAYLAQHEINAMSTLPHMKLRLLIDSSGANNDNVATVAQLIANRVARTGNLDHIIGVVGWPFSSQTINARDIIAAVHLPLVSETASSVKLSGTSPYFFRVNPPDDLQGKTLGTVAADPKLFNAKTVLVMRDTTDPYSTSLADAFTVSVRAKGVTAINNSADYFTEGTTTVANYQNVINDAVEHRADIIFLAGLDTDAVRLAHALGDAYRANPSSEYLANLKILGGDAVDTGLILGQGDGPDAAIAKNFPQDMRRLSFTAFGHPDEWAFEHLPQNQEPSFFHDWSSTYQSSTITANNSPNPGNDAMLSYDAVRVIIDGATLVHGSLTGQAIRDALASLGKGKIPPFQGVSGRILFDTQGNPIDKAVVVLEVVNGGNGNIIKLEQVAGRFK